MDRPVPTAVLFDSPEPDRPLTTAEEALVAALDPEELAAVDAFLLGNADERFRKVAWFVGKALLHMGDRHPLLPDVFYGQRVREFVKRGLLQSQGDLSRMRYSEARRV